jgi:hypothetical protein
LKANFKLFFLSIFVFHSIDFIGQKTNIDSELKNKFQIRQTDSNIYVILIDSVEIGTIENQSYRVGAFLKINQTEIQLDKENQLKSTIQNKYDVQNYKLEVKKKYNGFKIVEIQVRILNFEESTNDNFYNEFEKLPFKPQLKDTSITRTVIREEKVLFKETHGVISRINIETGIEERLFIVTEGEPYKASITIEYDDSQIPKKAEIWSMEQPEQSIIIKDETRLSKLDKIKFNYYSLDGFVNQIIKLNK